MSVKSWFKEPDRQSLSNKRKLKSGLLRIGLRQSALMGNIQPGLPREIPWNISGLKRFKYKTVLGPGVVA